MYLISVYFDDKANRILSRHIDKIARRTGNLFMTEHRVPPHMTLLGIEARKAEVLVPAFESLSEALTRGQIQFISVGQLLPYVFYTTPVMNGYLRNLHEVVYNTFSDISETKVSRYYQPDNLFPHVTLAKTLDKVQMRLALEEMQNDFQPFSAAIEKIGLAKVNPHEDVVSFILK